MKALGVFLAAALQVLVTEASPLSSIASVAEAVVRGIVEGDTSVTSQGSLDTSLISANQYITSENWAGASKSGTNITYNTATITVPNFDTDPDGWTTGLALFTAVDGYFSTPDKLTFAGIIIAAVKGERQYQFTGIWRSLGGNGSGGSENELTFPIRAGNKIRMSLHRLSDTRINGTLENLSTGQTVYRIMEASEGYPATDASWVVCRYISLGNWMRWLDFTDPITFTDVKAVTGAGETLSLEGADLLDIVPSGETAYTKCSIDGPSELTCLHP